MADDQVADESLDTEYPVTDQQVRSMHEQGWALLPGLLGDEAVQGLRDHLANEKQQTETAASAYRRDGDPATEVVNSNVLYSGMAWRDPFFRRVATSRRVAGAAVQLMKQPEALLIQDVAFVKPGGGGPTNPHQDYSYLPFDRKGELTLWIALVDITEDMGPLYYLESSHREGPLGLHGGKDIRDQYPDLFNTQIVAGKALKAGDAQAHWDLTIHGAVPNKTDRSREAYVARYIRTDTFYSGIGHPHFDKFHLTPGTRFVDSGDFPLVGAAGLVDA